MEPARHGLQPSSYNSHVACRHQCECLVTQLFAFPSPIAAWGRSSFVFSYFLLTLCLPSPRFVYWCLVLTWTFDIYLCRTPSALVYFLHLFRASCVWKSRSLRSSNLPSWIQPCCPPNRLSLVHHRVLGPDEAKDSFR